MTDTLISAREDASGAATPPPRTPPVAPVFKVVEDPETRVRRAVRLRRDTDQRAMYWADKANISVNEYVSEAVEEKIRRENGDYDLPTLEQARLGQLIDQMASLATNVANLQKVTTSGFDSLIGLTRGDNYLLDDENGEIGTEA